MIKIQDNLQRGVGIIHALATGPPTESERWIVQAVDMMQEIINAGAGLVLGESASLVYLDCSQSVSTRLGALRSFIGISTLRAMGVTQLPEEYTTEPLNGMS
jgi:ABC-type branched-subunit amino acid transport system substrate-binding protein